MSYQANTLANMPANMPANTLANMLAATPAAIPAAMPLSAICIRVAIIVFFIIIVAYSVKQQYPYLIKPWLTQKDGFEECGSPLAQCGPDCLISCRSAYSERENFTSRACGMRTPTTLAAASEAAALTAVAGGGLDPVRRLDSARRLDPVRRLDSARRRENFVSCDGVTPMALAAEAEAAALIAVAGGAHL